MFFDRGMDFDFSKVQVHADGEVADSAAEIGARAYTVSDHIVMSPDLYRPHTPAGRALLAHELTHVMQQRHGAPLVQRWGMDNAPIGDPKRDPRLKNMNGAGNAHDAREAEILRRSTKYMLGGAGEELAALVADPVFLISLGVAVGGYIALWVVPEPVVSKLAAALTTIAVLSTGVFTISTLVNVATAWADLSSDADTAQTDAEIEAAAQKFGSRVGATGADLILFLGSLLLGRALPTPKGLPPGPKAIANAEQTLSVAKPGGVLVEGPWGRLSAPGPAASEGPFVARSGNNLIVVEEAPAPYIKPVEEGPLPENVTPFPKPKPAAQASSPPQEGTVSPILPLPQQAEKPKQRPPFVLKLPKQKELHLGTYRSWLGTLQSDPLYERGSTAQEGEWHRCLRIGGSHAIRADVYERGHELGLTGVDGENRIRQPDWPHEGSESIWMQVDHIVELQLTPAAMRSYFDSVDNYELLDSTSNGSSGGLIRGAVARERAKQVAFDPSAATKVLKFDKVEVEGGAPGEHWTIDELTTGEQLDAYESSQPLGEP
jgi:hypothetical protein